MNKELLPIVIAVILIFALGFILADHTGNYVQLENVMSNASPRLRDLAFDQYMNLREFDRMLEAGLKEDHMTAQGVEEYADRATWAIVEAHEMERHGKDDFNNAKFEVDRFRELLDTVKMLC